MNKVLLLLAVLLGGSIVAMLGSAYAARRLWRSNPRKRISRLPGAMMEHCMDMMPEESPPKVMMSRLRRTGEQNEEILSLLREQNDLLRRRLAHDKAAPPDTETGDTSSQ